MRASLKTGMLLGIATLATIALAVLPGRVTLGQTQQEFGRSPTEFVIAGTLRDLSDLALPVGLIVLVVLAAVMILRGSRGPTALRAASIRAMTIALAIIALLVWLTASSAAEFKLQRGVDATWFDVQVGSGSPAPLRTFLAFLSCRRHWVPALCSFAAITALLFSLRSRAKRWTITRRLPLLAAFSATTTLGYASALVPLDPHVRVFRTISDRHVVGEPFVNLFTSFGHSQENVRLGMKGLIEHAHFPSSQSRGGEALLGVPAPASETVDCDIHPMARPLPVSGIEGTRAGADGHHALDADATRVMDLFDRLSTELYFERSTPIDVWQVMLESFRGDDIHAISPSAPRALAPFMNSLYESAAKGDASVIAVRRMWQAGSRTSQGLSSYMCGMGMLPYGLSITRDFGPIPIRCVPDVLVDASFDGSFFVGGNPSFDEMDTFFRHHGIREIVGQLQQPLSSPTAEGGVSDRALVAHAAESAARTAKTDRSRYLLVMTGSNHVPYRRPDDLPQEIVTRIDELQRLPGYTGTPDDVARLRTFAYADLALSDLVEHVGKNVERSVFVFGADHATGDPFVWPKAEGWNSRAAHALIPYAIVFPDPLVAKSAHPERVRALVRELNDALDHHVWSQNDTPLFLLTLLAHAPGMHAMATRSRWHTLGGERTSPYFAAPRPDVKVVGIDCVAELYGVDEKEQSLLPHETASFVKEPSEIYSASPTLIPVAATFSKFLKGYGTECGKQ